MLQCPPGGLLLGAVESATPWARAGGSVVVASDGSVGLGLVPAWWAGSSGARLVRHSSEVSSGGRAGSSFGIFVSVSGAGKIGFVVGISWNEMLVY